MRHTPVRRAALLLTSGLLAFCSVACSEGSTDGSSVRVHSSSKEAGPADDGADLPLSEDLTAEGERPAWALPVVQGWSTPAESAPGVLQIRKDGSGALVTAYQVNRSGDVVGGNDEQGGKAWLEHFHAQIVSMAEASEVTDPTYGTAVIESTRGSMEFVSQELEYSTPDGTRYRSRFLARSIGNDVFSLQYAAPADEFSENEWTELGESGLQLTL